MTLPIFTSKTSLQQPQPWRILSVGHARTQSNVSDLSLRTPSPSPVVAGRKRAEPSPVSVSVILPVGRTATFFKPPYSFTKLIRMALEASTRGRMYLFEIYDYIRDTWPYYRHSAPGWKNSVRHALSSCRDFCHLPRDPHSGMKGAEWTLRTRLSARRCNCLKSSSDIDEASQVIAPARLVTATLANTMTGTFNAFCGGAADEELDLIEVAQITENWIRRQQASEISQAGKLDVMLFNGSAPSSSPPQGPLLLALEEDESTQNVNIVQEVLEEVPFK